MLWHATMCLHYARGSEGSFRVARGRGRLYQRCINAMHKRPFINCDSDTAVYASLSLPLPLELELRESLLSL